MPCVGGGGASYESSAWCAGGAAADGHLDKLGKKRHYPERNCCICGKGEIEIVALEVEDCLRKGKGQECEGMAFANRVDFVQYPLKIRKPLQKPQVPDFFQHCFQNAMMKKKIPKMQKLLGFNDSGVCDDKSICGVVKQFQDKLDKGEYDKYFIQGSSGKYCKAVEIGDKMIRRPSAVHLAALKSYTWADSNGRFYRSLNRDLQQQKKDKGGAYRKEMLDKWGVYLNYFLSALDCIDQSGNPEFLYRGIHINENKRQALVDEYKVNRTVIWTGVSSTSSLEEKTRKRFATGGDKKNKSGIVFQIRPSLAFDIIKFSLYKAEKEYIVPPMSKFKVEAVRDVNDVKYVDLLQQDVEISDMTTFGSDAFEIGRAHV